jgi:hypothetical protein
MTVSETKKPTDDVLDMLDNTLIVQITEKLRKHQICQPFIDYSIECLQKNVILSLDNWKSLTQSQKDTYPGTLKDVMNEMATEMDLYRTLTLFDKNVKEGLRRSGCSENCDHVSMLMLRRDKVGCLEVWNNLTEVTKLTYPIECRRVLEQMQPKPEWWEFVIPYLVALIVIGVLFWCLEAFLYAMVERNVWIPVFHYRGDDIKFNQGISALLSVFVFLFMLFALFLYAYIAHCNEEESKRSATIRVLEIKAAFGKRCRELKLH